MSAHAAPTVAAMALTAAMAVLPAPGALGQPQGFHIEQMYYPKTDYGLLMQMVFLPDGRALLVEKSGSLLITEPEKPGFPIETYMKLEGVHDVDEVGLISVLISEGWAHGDRKIYLFWGHHSGMRISEFEHDENAGGLSSRGKAWTERVLWYDTDGFPYTEDTSGMGYTGVLWHYGGKLSWGPDHHIYLTTGDKYR